MNTKPHKHAAVIHAWADGAILQTKDPEYINWVDVEFPQFDEKREYRIKPSIPQTTLNAIEFTKLCKEGTTWIEDARNVANAAIARAIEDKDVVIAPTASIIHGEFIMWGDNKSMEYFQNKLKGK